MYNRYHYLIVGFIILILYLLYLIIRFHLSQFQIDNFTQKIITHNKEIETRNSIKEQTERYIRTPAYISQTAKTMQNKKMPWEEVINIIKQEDIDGNTNIDSQEVFAKIKSEQEDPTLKMSNIEKWKHLFRSWLRK